MSDKPKSERCETCRFWDPSAEEGHAGLLGDCRRHAPKINETLLVRHLLPPSYSADVTGLEGSVIRCTVRWIACPAVRMTDAPDPLLRPAPVTSHRSK